jgi:hypothetical protein
VNLCGADDIWRLETNIIRAAKIKQLKRSINNAKQ